MTHRALDLKRYFPFFKAHPEIVYLDTAATSQKPQSVIDAISAYYENNNATVHRTAYSLSVEATRLYEEARALIAAFIGSDSEHLIFTKSATESLNLIAFGLRKYIQEGDEILVCETEHHANLLPWQRLAEEKNAKLVKLPVDDQGRVNIETLKKHLHPKTKILALAHMSNVTGVIHNIKQISLLLKDSGVLFIVDGAQGIAHEKIDVLNLNLDGYVFSSHKIYGPTGLGACHVSDKLLALLDLYQVGGDVIEKVSFEHTSYKKGRYRFEAGTPMIAEVIGLAAAIRFLNSLDLEAIYSHERALILKLKQGLQQIPGLVLLGDSDAGLISFYSEKIHPLDIATFLDTKHIAIRSGHLCAQTCLARFHTQHAARISLGIYNNHQDVEKVLKALEEAILLFS